MNFNNSGNGTGYEVAEIPVIILCGGMGTRMGTITETLPKSLIAIQGKPIIWYIVLRLYRDGFRKFVLPLGYKGSLIKDYVDSELAQLHDIHFQCIDTGNNTGIAQRLGAVLEHNSFNQDILLLNGDAIFDFSLSDIYQRHISLGSLVSLISVEPRSKWALILDGQDGVEAFVRDEQVRYFTTTHTPSSRAYVYSGIAFINTRVFDYIELSQSTAFESDLFPAVIQKGELANVKTKHFWFSIDTAKDISELSHRAVGDGIHVNAMRENMLKYLDTHKGRL